MAKVIKLTDNSNVTLLPISDSAYIQHKWKTGWDPESSQTVQNITSVQDALNNVIDRVDTLNVSSHADHNDLQTLSYTSGTGIQLKDDATGTASGTVKVEGSGLITITGSSDKMIIGTTATNNPGTVTSVTPGSGLLNGTGTTAITGSGTLNVALKDYTKNSSDATTADTSGGTLEPVQLDKSGKLAVYVKDTHNNHTITWSGSNWTPDTTSGPDSVNVISYYNAATNTLNPNGTISYITTTVPTIKYVDDKIGSAIHLKGTVGPSDATTTSLPSQNVKEGDAYLVKLSSGTNTSILSGQTLENGDLIIATSITPTWTVVQNNLSIATSSKAGTVKPGTTSGKNYGVSVATDGAMTVNVPWTDNDHTSSVKLSGTKDSNNVVSNITLSTSTSGDNTEYTLAITYSSIETNKTSSLFVGGSSSTTTTAVAAQGPAYILHKEGTAVNSKVGFVGDNTWIQVSYSPVNSNIKFEHIGPGSGTDRNATQKTDASRLSDTSKVIVGLSYTSDDKGHITKVSYTMAQLPDIPVITTKKTGSGNVVTYVSANDHEITYYMGITALTAHQDHAFTNKAIGSSGNYELKLSKGSSGSGSSVYFTPANGVKLTTTGGNTLTISGTSVNVAKAVSYTSGMYAVIGKDADLNETWLSNALGTPTGTTYIVNNVSNTTETVWGYTA